jgi:CubicO group peptidase (beta-lactamase class C family)
MLSAGQQGRHRSVVTSSVEASYADGQTAEDGMALMDRRRLMLAAGAAGCLPAFDALAQAMTITPMRPDGTAIRDPREMALARATMLVGAPPATAAALVSRDGLQWSGVRGVRRSGQDGWATLDDRWHLGSNTKAMTAVVWARLVEQGRARWGMPLSEAFPDTTLHEAYAALTVEDLMRHKAGLSDRTDFPVPVVARADTRPTGEQRAALVRALTLPPSGAVGTFAYGNVNYVLVGSVIERITGRPWEDVIAAEVFTPLAITSAGFGAPLTNAVGGPNAWGHRVQGQTSTPVDPAEPFADNPPMLGPAGTVHMTIADYARFIQAMLGGGTAGWLSADSLWRLATPLSGERYALGWITGPDGSVGHEGSNTLWHAITLMQPDAGMASIVLSNGGLDGRRTAAPLAQKLLQEFGSGDAAAATR